MRRFRYDAAGQLVAAVNGLGGVTTYEHDDRGRVVRVTDPAGGVTTRRYTSLDKVEESTDPVGRVTTATYDAAGRQTSQRDPDGHVTRWTYDAAGLLASTAVDGRVLNSVARNPRDRSVVVTDHTRGDGEAVEHRLEYNRRGQLVRRFRGEQCTAWEYDGDGHQSAFISHLGVRTAYTRDAVGRLTGVSNPTLGEVSYTYDASGRRVSAEAGGRVQAWTYDDGWLAGQTSGEGSTRITRDEDGRVVAVARGGQTSAYTYDEAGQLTGAITLGAGGARTVRSWVYDRAGRLVAEDGPQGERAYTYDDAGQLLSVSGAGGGTDYAYDGLGRRVSAVGGEGSESSYRWGPSGFLAGTTTRRSDGDVVDLEVWVDALGELATISSGDGDTEVWWDSAALIPALTGIGEHQVLALPGGITGTDDTWLMSSGRGVRGVVEDDPWLAIGAPGVPATPGAGGSGAGVGSLDGMLPEGVGLTGSGALSVGGLEWMGARVYDSGSRGFLSVDPLEPVTGSVWGSNPYSFAGNDPVGLADPTGLRPATQDDLDAYAAANQTVWAQAGDWLAENWEYVAGGAMVIAGGVLIATGVGGPLGGALLGAGIDTIVQKATTGEVDWGQVAIGGAFGMVGGGVAAQLVANVGEGVVSAGYDYFTGPGPHGVGTALLALGAGATVGAVASAIPGGKHTPTPTKPLGEIPASAIPAPGGPTILTAKGDLFGANASHTVPVAGYHDVAIHGSPTDFGRSRDSWIDKENFDHRVLARLIQNDPEYPGGPIRLLSCSTGSLPDGAAQNLSNKLGVDVLAPDDTIWAWPDGSLAIGPTSEQNCGRFVQFSPGR